MLTPQPLLDRLGAKMACFFDLDVTDGALGKLPRASSTGRALGAAEWVKALEASTERVLASSPMDRPRRGAVVEPAGALL